MANNAYSAWNTVDEMVSKPVLGSDGAASWQDFQKKHKKRAYGTGSAPIVPSKRADKLGTGFQSLEEERLHERKIRNQNGELAMGSGYTHFKKKEEENIQLSEIEPRIRPENKIYFIPSDEFTGWKEDYVFTTRHRGVGYYWDGMDTLRKQMGTTVSYETNKINETKEHKKKKKKSSKKIKENPSSIIDPDSKNPYEQIANAIQRRDALLMAQSMGYSRQTFLNTSSDWVEAIDPSTKKTYYYNSKTRQTRWDNPNSKKESKKEIKSKDLPSEWKSATDSNGKVYYYNTKTKETTWNRPKSFN